MNVEITKRRFITQWSHDEYIVDAFQFKYLGSFIH